jgi:ABC-type transport system involved in cytochrome bd biosynthesis fused ATPase/permease subunit
MANDASSILAATDLVVRYNEQVVLDGASLTIHEGEHVGLVGRNGSGKSDLSEDPCWPANAGPRQRHEPARFGNQLPLAGFYARSS